MKLILKNFDRLKSLVKWFGLSRLIGSLVSLVVVALSGWWLLRVPPPPPEYAMAFASVTTVLGTFETTTQPTIEISAITVHVAGAVVAPGVYVLDVGSRVNDGVAAAGGATTQADLNSVNLATILNEGEQIYIPKRNEKPHIIVQPRSPSLPSSAGNIASGSAMQIAPLLININTATAIELEQLPGVGPSTSKAIIAYREKNGAFISVEDLLNVRGIGPAKLGEILPQARVK